SCGCRFNCWRNARRSRRERIATVRYPFGCALSSSHDPPATISSLHYMSSPRTVLLLLAVFAAASSVQAQDRLLTPAAFLGYELGTRFTPHHRVIDYAEHVAAHSPNVRLEHYGETYEGRPLVVLYIASPENLSRLETIRMDNLRR